MFREILFGLEVLVTIGAVVAAQLMLALQVYLDVVSVSGRVMTQVTDVLPLLQKVTGHVGSIEVHNF